MDFFVEILFETYLSLAEILIPEHKFKKWQETLLKLAGIVVSLIIFFCLAFGISLIIEDGGIAGIILTSVGGVLLIIQTVIFITVLVHEIKTEKLKKAQNKDGEPAN